MSGFLTAAEERFRLVFDGPVDNSPETLRRIKGVFIADLDLSVDKVIEIFNGRSATVKESDSEAALTPALRALRLAGGRVSIVPPSASLTSAEGEICLELVPLEPIGELHANGDGVNDIEAGFDGEVDELLSRLTQSRRVAPICPSHNEGKEALKLDFELPKTEADLVKAAVPAPRRAAPKFDVSRIPQEFDSSKILAEMEKNISPKDRPDLPKPGAKGRGPGGALTSAVISICLIFAARAAGAHYQPAPSIENRISAASSAPLGAAPRPNSEAEILYARKISGDQDSIVRLKFDEDSLGTASLRVSIAPSSAAAGRNSSGAPQLRLVEVDNLQALDLGGGRFEAKGFAFATIEIQGARLRLMTDAKVRGRFDRAGKILEGDFEISRGTASLPQDLNRTIGKTEDGDFVFALRDRFSSPTVGKK